MATDNENETVEEAEAIIGNKGCSKFNTIERMKKSVIWTIFLFIRKTIKQNAHLAVRKCYKVETI